MEKEARLQSLLFRLTPTRTRCDLVITSNGKTEKLASGLSNPFLAHLKTAQEQIAKGGYSIVLQPDPETEVSWFTKATVEKFVRFVSTPGVLERVNTIELEILQIEEAITVQRNECLALATVDEHPVRPPEQIEGSTPVDGNDADKAIVLYKPEANPPQSNGPAVQAENSKIQLLRVLETRKTVLQKEQAMAFARASAAGFDMDQLSYLISFAECFGASRLRTASLKFMELWKGKHESGQWIEIETAEVMSMQSEFSSMNASGIMFAGDGWQGPNGSMGLENDRKTGSDNGTEMDSDPNKGRNSGDPQIPFQGQFQHPMYPQWPIHPVPGGPPVFQPYPMPYYQNFPGGGPYFQPPYAPMEDPRLNSKRRTRTKKHPMDGIDNSNEPGVARSQDDMDLSPSELDDEVSDGRGTQKKLGRSGKKKSGVVVIRNINYITSKKHMGTGSESESASISEDELGSEDVHSDARERRHRNSSKFSKSKERQTMFNETSNSYDEDMNNRNEGSSDNWQAFQNFLLRDEEDGRADPTNVGMFSGEKVPSGKRRQGNSGADPLLHSDRGSHNALNRRMVDFDTSDSRMVPRSRKMTSSERNDGFVYSSDGRALRGDELDGKFQQMEIEGGGYRQRSSDEFMIYGCDKQPSNKTSLDPLSEDINKFSANSDKTPQANFTDESFVVPLRSGSHEDFGTDRRTAIDIYSEFPSTLETVDDGTRNQVYYEPLDLNLMPERESETRIMGYDPAMDYGVEINLDNNNASPQGPQEDTSKKTKTGANKSNKEKRPQTLQDRRKMDALRRGRPSRSSPLVEAQARAEKLRAYKVDLQRMKKEKEEEERKRLDALKRERQKRIAARANNVASPTQSSPLQNRPRIPSKLSPGSTKVSKFSDIDVQSLSSSQKLPIRSSTGSMGSLKTTGNSRVSGTHSAENGLSRSVPSLADLKKEKNGSVPEQKTVSRIKRLSDPKASPIHPSSVKSAVGGKVPKQTTSNSKGNKIMRASSITSESRDSATDVVSDEPQIKKISAVTSLQSSNAEVNKPMIMETTWKATKSETSLDYENNKGKTADRAEQLSDADDNLVVEKNVLTHEQERVRIPAVPSVEMAEDKGESTNLETVYAAIRSPITTAMSSELGKGASDNHVELPTAYEVSVDNVKGDSQKFSTSPIPTENSYEAPLARLSSMEGTSTITMDQSGTLSAATNEMSKTQKSIAADRDSVDQLPEVHEQPRLKESPVKESPKGFKRLLKFGRKSHTSASDDHQIESDSSSIHDSPVAVSPSEVPTLKSIISEDDSHSGSTAKASRSFSILSPFRGKSSDKKVVT